MCAPMCCQVITRRQAWHWVNPPAGPHWNAIKQEQIRSRVDHNVRPKMPAGLHSDVAVVVRKCLHHDPSCRPDAKGLTKWLGIWLDRLGKSMMAQRGTKVSEQSEKRRAETGEASVVRDWAVVDLSSAKVAARWSRGLFSLHQLRHVAGRNKQSVLQLELNPQTRADWEELGCDEHPDGVATQPGGIVALQPLGIKFDSVDPTLVVGIETKTKTSKLRTLAPYFPELTAGCTLISVNGQPCTVEVEFTAADEALGLIVAGLQDDNRMWGPKVKRIEPGSVGASKGLAVGAKLLFINGTALRGMNFKSAAPLLRSRPLALIFTAFDEQTESLVAGTSVPTPPLQLQFLPFNTEKHALVSAWPSTNWSGLPASSVPEWLQAGLTAVNTVRSHEKQAKKRKLLEEEERWTSMQWQLGDAQAEIVRLQEELRQAQASSGVRGPAAYSAGVSQPIEESIPPHI